MYELKEVLSLLITVKEQKNRLKINQCFKSQRFGHNQSKSTAEPKCVKCAGSHLIGECIKEKNTPAKCCTCNENYPASYRECKTWPTSQKKAKQKMHSQAAQICINSTRKSTKKPLHKVFLTKEILSHSMKHSEQLTNK